MALDLKLKLQTYTADCDTQLFNDDTVYGGAELARNQVAVIVEAQKSQLPDEQNVPLGISGNDSNPLTDIQWTMTSTYDGWHTLPMYVIPLYVPATTYTPGKVLYEINAIWINIQTSQGIAPGSDPSYWTQITLADNRDDVEAADNVQYQYFQYIITCRSEKCYAKVTSAETTEGCCEGCTNAELKQTAERLDVLLNGISVKCTQLKYAEAEEVVRNMIHICEKSKCVCD